MRGKSKILGLLLALVMVLGTMPAVAFAEGTGASSDEGISPEAEEMVSTGDYTEDQVIVVFNKGVSDSKAEAICEKNGVEVQDIEATSDGQKAVLAETADGQSVAEAITDIAKEKKVDYVQPNYRYGLAKADPFNNDQATGQWYLGNIHAREAADILKDITADKVKVAVVDTGADTNHEDLQANLNKDLSIKLDHKGGWEQLIDDSDEHGTHVSGIIAATYDNGKGTAGVTSLSGNKVADLFVIDSCTSTGLGVYLEDFDIVTGINYAVDNGAKVISMSFGGYGRDRYLEETLDTAYERGAVLVAAAGNENTDEYGVPSDVGSVISVCNTTIKNRRQADSCYGTTKDISAPGTSIISTVPGNGYEAFTGTSMATPVISSVAAAILYVNPDLTPYQVKNIICATADNSICSNGGDFDEYTGYGLVDMKAAVEAARDASADIAPTSISVKPYHDAQYMTLAKEDRYRMETLVLPATSLAEVTYESSAPDVAEVDSLGLITAKDEGTAVITARAGSVETHMTIYVEGGDVPEQIIIQNAAGEDLGDEITVPTGIEDDVCYLDTKVLPISAANRKIITWRSSDPTTATVNTYGIISGNRVGDAVISAETYNGVKDEITVHVKDVASKVTFTAKKKKFTIGETFTYAAKVTPADAIDTKIEWSSSNRNVAQINKDTGAVTTKSAGQANIIARTKYGALAKVRITVYRTDYAASYYNLKATAKSSSKIKLSWKGVPNSDGFYVYRSKGSSSNYSRIKTLKGSAKSFTNTKLKKNTKYNYKIRAYYTDDNGKKHWCKYSTKASARTKK
ncbi:MAG: S8 family serine peptidase [Firmicutes bacterium]|nr:S8 family serine peptidase [Bacillota bacterium]